MIGRRVRDCNPAPSFAVGRQGVVSKNNLDTTSFVFV
jgi:hypothetical protein